MDFHKLMKSKINAHSMRNYGWISGHYPSMGTGHQGYNIASSYRELVVRIDMDVWRENGMSDDRVVLLVFT
jgi:hypothetical protein